MTRYANRLTDTEVRQVKPDPTKNIVLLDGHGLRLVVTPAGRKYWQFKTAAGGKESTCQVGSYPAMTLELARRKAQEMRDLVREGRSPVAENRLRRVRERTTNAMTFEVVAAKLLEVKRKNCSPAYYKKISGGIKANLLPLLGPLPIKSIDSPILKEALRKLEDRGALEMLGNVRRWAGEVFDYAKAEGQYSGDNPADALLRNVFQKHSGENMRALAWQELPGFMSRLSAMNAEKKTVCAIRLLIMTACRPGEILGAKWEEVDFKNACWVIPPARMKMRKLHKVPLSKQAIATLKELHLITGAGEYLFPSRPGSKVPTLSGMALLKATKRAAGRDIHAHGFRAMFSTHVAESLKWPDVVKEAALAHSKKSIEGVYDKATYYPKRVKLMQWYADEIEAACKGGEQGQAA